MSAEGQQGGAAAIGEETEVADADKAGGQQVEKEAAQELIGGQRHESFPVAVSGVPPAEGDLAIFEGDEPVVGDGDAMGVSAEIAQGGLRSAEARRQKFLFTRLEPAYAGVALTVGAMPVATRVIRDGDVPAVGAAVAMTTQRSRTAAQDGPQNLAVMPGDPAPAAVQEAIAYAADDIGHLQR